MALSAEELALFGDEVVTSKPKKMQIIDVTPEREPGDDTEAIAKEGRMLVAPITTFTAAVVPPDAPKQHIPAAQEIPLDSTVTLSVADTSAIWKKWAKALRAAADELERP